MSRVSLDIQPLNIVDSVDIVGIVTMLPCSTVCCVELLCTLQGPTTAAAAADTEGESREESLALS